ncbi:hypothetical protein I3842_09G227100 [Carya illinoinensis]|uniref:Uncharacterized protein n=1 Tax=Carya illinoinensis TaxID=32201 RepID=A0A922E9S8_CARIL|nr:hypothetical protein I3842_09G227100 [Carya illinoinensis]
MGSAQYYMHKGAPFMTGRSISATACGIWQRNGGTRSSLRSSLLLLIINNKKEKIRFFFFFGDLSLFIFIFLQSLFLKKKNHLRG